MSTTQEKQREWDSIGNLTEKLIRARCRLMTREPWYGHIAMSMVWLPSDFPFESVEAKKTMGVRIIAGGRIECLWYPGFVHSQSLRQLYATVHHEIEHIVRCHCLRIGSHRDPEGWNVAADMTVNGRRDKPKIGYKDTTTNRLFLPLDGNLVWVPDGWKEDQTTEYYYNKLLTNVPSPTCGSCGASGPGGGKAAKGKQKGGRDGKCPNCGKDMRPGPGQFSYGGVSGQQVDNHSVWSQSDISQDEARQLIKDLTDQATAKCQGFSPGHLAEALRELGTPVVRWRELLRRFVGTHVGNSRRTYARRNRRYDFFGMPGISHHAAGKVRVIVDTSGSIGQKELQQFFAEIELTAAYAEVKVLQWDASFQGYGKYRRGDWKKWKIAGRGGTDMAAPIQWLTENRLLGDCQIMLTDGYCNWSPQQPWFPELGMITVITTPEATTTSPTWGHVVRLKVNE